MSRSGMQKSVQISAFLIFIVLGVGAFVWIYLVLPQHTSITTVSTLDFSPTKQTEKKSQSEPVIASWINYSNDKYTVSFSVPEDWYQQDFSASYPHGGTLVAFSPDPLPCDTCTYFKNGFFSLHIYNQKSDPDMYTSFLQRIKNAQNDKTYQLISTNSGRGVIYANTLAIEHFDWVYELSLDANDGKTKITDSAIMQKVTSSFQFTGLIFNK